METIVKKIAHCFNRAFFSAPNAVPAPANASGIVRHAPQKFSLIVIYYLLKTGHSYRRKVKDPSRSSKGQV
jgi:hypothetical protein